MEEKKHIRKQKVGLVISNRMDKTVVVRVERVFKHTFFKKVVKNYRKFKAHDEGNKCKIGDKVIISETRPLSSDKRWRVVKIIGHEKVVLKELPGRLHKKVKEEGAVGAIHESPQPKEENDTSTI